MRCARGVTTTAQAIQQVFDIPLNSSCRPAFYPRLRFRTTCPYARHFSIANPRSATYKPLTERPNPVIRRREIDPSLFGPQSQVEHPPRDEEISARDVVTRLPNGRLSEVTRLETILDRRMMDEKGKYKQYVQVVAPADPAQNRPFPIVAYFGKKELKEKELAAKKKEKETGAKEKSLEFSWSIDDHDLKHRMDKLKGFLQKGKKVEVLFGSRGWRVMKREISDDEAQSLLAKIREAALQVEGTQVMQVFKGTLLREGTMTFQGPLKTLKQTKEDIEEKKQESVH